MSTKHIIQLSRSEFAEAFLYLNGKPFSLKDYPHMVDVYNSGADKIVMKTSRQVSKSTTLANMMLANAAMIPFHRQLFVSPAVAQTTEFSRSKLEPVIQLSPFYRKYLLDPTLVQNVFKKEFKNGSVIDLRYALLTADRIRGISTDRVFFDECFPGNTEVLTKNGWKPFLLATIHDEYATVDSNLKIVYQKPLRFIKKRYNDVLVDFKHGIKVTLNHNVFYKTFNNYQLTLAKNLINKTITLLNPINKTELTVVPEVTEFTYVGNVYCVTVPNHTLIVRDPEEKLPVVMGNCQDLREDVINVIEETMNRSLWKKAVYAGTPKRTKGTLANLWFASTQNEYAIKSHRCGHWNILGPENIGQHGLICNRCGLPLNLQIDKGEWVSTYSNLQKPQIEGFRVCALHFAHAPWVDWQRDIIYKMENQSRQIFYNETLGLEYDSGTVPITKEELIKACNENTLLLDAPDQHAQGRISIMGIDYGPVASEHSNTVIVVLQERGGYLQIVYAKKFLGKEADPAYIHEEIPKLMDKWNCQILAADHGMGEASNSEIRRRIGYERVVAFQHLPAQKLPIQWNPNLPAYTLNKTQILDRIIAAVKNGKIKFPKWEHWEPFAEDFQNLIIEYDEDKNTRRYDHIGPDDLVHATTYAACAAMMAFENVHSYI